MPRYAVYHAPAPDSPWAAFGRTWLGRDASTGLGVSRDAPAGLSLERFDALTEEPRRYGFHATLKAPISLATGASRAQLVEAMHATASMLEAASLAPLRLKRIGDFLALVPGVDPADVNHIAAVVTERLDAFRAPPDAAELARRLRHPLTDRQRDHLRRWGYPYVFADYRCHYTLTSSLAGATKAEVDALHDALESALMPLAKAPLVIDCLCLFEEPAPGAPFVETLRVPLKGRESRI